MKAARRPQFWFNLAMWVVSIVIASLLIQLGALIMTDVPYCQQTHRSGGFRERGPTCRCRQPYRQH